MGGLGGWSHGWHLRWGERWQRWGRYVTAPGAFWGAEGAGGRFARWLQQRVPFSRRQLSEELLAARGALEKESQLRDQARREKEELLYRVLNGGDGSPFPIAAGEVSLIAT